MSARHRRHAFAGLGALTMLSWLRVARTARRFARHWGAWYWTGVAAVVVVLPAYFVHRLVGGDLGLEAWTLLPSWLLASLVLLTLTDFPACQPAVALVFSGPVSPRAMVAWRLGRAAGAAAVAALGLSAVLWCLSARSLGLLRPWLVIWVLLVAGHWLGMALAATVLRRATWPRVLAVVTLAVGVPVAAAAVVGRGADSWLERFLVLLRTVDDATLELLALQQPGAWVFLAAMAIVGALGAAWSLLHADTLRDVVVERSHPPLTRAPSGSRRQVGVPDAERASAS